MNSPIKAKPPGGRTDSGIGISRSKMPEPTGKAGQLVSLLEQRLTLGYYAPGEMLSFNTLAEEFGVSRQPVSAAILHLRAAGFVEVIPHVGCRVVVPSPLEVHDFFFISSKIESAVVTLAAERYEDSEGKELLAIKPPEDVSALDAQDKRLAYVYLWQGIPTLAPSAAQKLNRERTAIAKAIVARDAQTAANLMEAHIRHKPALCGITAE